MFGGSGGKRRKKEGGKEEGVKKDKGEGKNNMEISHQEASTGQRFPFPAFHILIKLFCLATILVAGQGKMEREK